MKKKYISAVALAFVLACTSISYVGAEQTKVMDYQHLSEVDKVEIIGNACQQDYQKSGILASVSAAQCILESGYMSTDLAIAANNCFGMKATLSGNTWASVWDGVSTYNKNTQEEINGVLQTINADFRSYASLEDSIADHSAYLLGAKSDSGYRYQGLVGEKDYRKAITIIKNGGYATDSSYIDKICSIIERFDLTRYDKVDESVLAQNIANNQLAVDNQQSSTQNQGSVPVSSFVQSYLMNNDEYDTQEVAVAPTEVSVNSYSDQYYRIRKTWADDGSQIGAYYNLNYAKRACVKGYTVFDPEGKIIYINK